MIEQGGQCLSLIKGHVMIFIQLIDTGLMRGLVQCFPISDGNKPVNKKLKFACELGTGNREIVIGVGCI